MKIPKLSANEDEPGPGWLEVTQGSNTRPDDPQRPARPVIVCACGAYLSIPRHHVHADGRVTASIQHVNEPRCSWHETVELDGYDGPEFPPEPAA